MEASPNLVTGLYDRTPPFSLEAETAVLGGMLIDREAVTRAMEHLDDSMFYREANRRLYRSMVRLFERGDVIDVITVSEELKKTAELDAAGGFDYLANLVDAVPTAANLEYHARIVRDKALLRRLIQQAQQIVRDVYEQGEREVEEILDQAETRIFQVAESHKREGFVWIKEILWSAFEHIERLQESTTGITGVPTGFPDLDVMTTGLQKGDLCIVAARPSMGKTSWVMNVAANAAITHSIPVALFSLEMSSEQLAQRLLCAEGRIDAQRLRRGRLSQEEHERLAAAAGHLNTAPIWIDDQPGANVLEIRAKSRRLQSELRTDGKDLGLIVIDYMQLMAGTSRAESRVQEVSEISRGLKALARELEVPVVALSQLSRGPEQRTDKRPMLSDLRESGCLTGDTLVELAHGAGRVPIRELVGRSGFSVLALNEETERLEPAPVSRAFSTGTKPVFRLRTALGRTIRATANHRFLSIGGWKRLDALNPGEHIALPRFLPSGRARTLSDLALALRGHWIGEGCTLPRHSIRDTTREADLAGPVTAVASEPLHSLSRSDICWDAVVSMEPDGVEEVFDLTVPGPHNFVADDVIVHNSIEQDADLVMFLYRPEYYAPQEKREELEGQAELIVGKQRNGPTGVVPLYFQKAYTRFDSAAHRPGGGGGGPQGAPRDYGP